MKRRPNLISLFLILLSFVLVSIYKKKLNTSTLNPDNSYGRNFHLSYNVRYLNMYLIKYSSGNVGMNHYDVPKIYGTFLLQAAP